MAKNIAALNRFGIYKLSIYKNSWKKTDKIFFLVQRKIGYNVEEEGWSRFCENTAFLRNNCNCSSTFFSYLVKV